MVPKRSNRGAVAKVEVDDLVERVGKAPIAGGVKETAIVRLFRRFPACRVLLVIFLSNSPIKDDPPVPTVCVLGSAKVKVPAIDRGHSIRAPKSQILLGELLDPLRHVLVSRRVWLFLRHLAHVIPLAHNRIHLQARILFLTVREGVKLSRGVFSENGKAIDVRAGYQRFTWHHYARDRNYIGDHAAASVPMGGPDAMEHDGRAGLPPLLFVRHTLSKYSIDVLGDGVPVLAPHVPCSAVNGDIEEITRLEHCGVPLPASVAQEVRALEVIAVDLYLILFRERLIEGRIPVVKAIQNGAIFSARQIG